MGLDVSHDAWHGAYSAFNRFRTALAELGGFGTLFVAGEVTKRMYSEDVIMRSEWPEPPHDPLLVLLIHADCDGVILNKWLTPLADRLEQLLPSLYCLGDLGGHVGDIQETTRKFIAGCRLAAESGEDLEFG